MDASHGIAALPRYKGRAVILKSKSKGGQELEASKWIKVFLFCLVLMTAVSVSAAGSGINFTCQAPYYLGKVRDTVTPGERIQMLFSVENRSSKDQVAAVTITLPAGFQPEPEYENWQIGQQGTQYDLYREVKLAGGYSQWFDLAAVQAAVSLEPGTYYLTVEVNDEIQQVPVKVAEGERVTTDAPVELEDIVLPLDREGRMDDRLDRNTLVLRDRSWDYYKNLLRGKGASNQEVEAIHPLAYLGLDIKNPARQQSLVLATIRLLDVNTQQPVTGLFTPGTTSEDHEAGAMGGHEDRLVALVALNGDMRQRIQLPVYADEQFVSSGGRYLLQVELTEKDKQLFIKTIPITIVKKDRKAAAVVGTASLILAAACLFGLRCLRQVLKAMKTRWLVTIALFGAAAFAVVNVPTTLLNDFFHIILGPFGFIVTGLFHGVFLYMMIVALVMLIPQPGVVALMTMIRMLLGMLAFGQVTPIGILVYGTHAFMLELLLTGSGTYRRIQSGHAVQRSSWQLMLLLAVICGFADSAATYINLQGMAFLYRLYYADWYIALILLLNGFAYTAVGAACGTLLGRRLSKVGGD